MLGGVGLAGDQVVNLGQHSADLEGVEGPPAAFLVVGGGVIDLKIRGIGEMTR
jgi:hypothetical protein